MQIESTAIVVHHLQDGHGSGALSVVTHDLRQTDSGYDLGPGRVFSSADKLALSRVLVEDLNTGIEFLSEHCLVANLDTLMWYRPRCKTQLCVNGQSYVVPLPSLLFLCHQGKLYVRAYKGSRRPHAETELYAPGLPNLYAEGSWCSGGNRLPAYPGQRHIPRIETMFFESPFTHAGSDPVPSGAVDIGDWFESLQSKRSYPASALERCGQTLGGWVRSVCGGR